MYKLQLLAQEALANNHVFSSWVVPWWASLCKTPATKHVRFKLCNWVQMISNFVRSHILCVLVWTDAETLGFAEGADGVVVEIGIVDAMLQVWMLMLQFMILHFMSFRFSRSRADDSYLWSVYSAARLRASQQLWGGCKQNCCWDHTVRVLCWCTIQESLVLIRVDLYVSTWPCWLLGE